MVIKSKLNKESLRIGLPFEADGLDDFADLYEKGHPNYKKYVERVKKSLYYGSFPSTDRPSKALTELLVDKFCDSCNQDGLDRLNLYDASSISLDACVTPCSAIVALLYLDRLRTQNPEYLSKTSSSQVFVVAMMVASKFLYDDGEEDEVYNDEWATSAAMILTDLNQAEKMFLNAIDWNLYVDITKFITGLSYIECEVAQKEALSRGYFIYSDLVALSRVLPPVWTSLISIIGSALVVCTVGYTLSLTIITAGVFMGRHIDSNLTPILSSTENNTTTESMLCSPNIGASELDSEISLLVPDSVVDFEDDDKHFEDSKCRPSTNNKRRSSRFPAFQTLTAALLLASSTTTKLVTSAVRSSYNSLPNLSVITDYLWDSSTSTSTDSDSNRLFTPPTDGSHLTWSRRQINRDRGRHAPRKTNRLPPKSSSSEQDTNVRNSNHNVITNLDTKLHPTIPSFSMDRPTTSDSQDPRVLPTQYDFTDRNYTSDLLDRMTYPEYNNSISNDDCDHPNILYGYGQACNGKNESYSLRYFWRSLDILQFSSGNFGRDINVHWLRYLSFIT